jgi:PAS domain S-box-containing protein
VKTEKYIPQSEIERLSLESKTLLLCFRIFPGLTPRKENAYKNSVGFFASSVSIHRSNFFISESSDTGPLEENNSEVTVFENEDLFRSVANSAPVMIWMSGPDKLCTYFNKPWLDFTGRSLEMELGNGWAEGVHSEDLPRCLNTYVQAFDRREEFQMEYRLRRHDGEYRWIFDRGVPRFNPDNSFAGYIGSCVDVTDRKRMEEALRTSEERFRFAAQAGKMFAYEWDPVNDVITRSGDCSSILGIDEKALTTGQEILHKIHPEDRERVKECLAQVSPEKPQIQISYRMVRPDGSIIWVERKSHAYFDAQGKLLRITGMIADITSRKQSEQQLDLFHYLFMEASLGIAVEDMEGRLLLANPALCSILGYAAEELVGMSCDQFADDKDSEDDWEHFQKLCSGKMERYSLEKRYRRKDGTQIWGQLNVSLLESKNGEPALVLALVEDITERKKAEEALRQKDSQLTEAQRLARVGSWQWNPELDIVIWSEQLYKIAGRDPDLPAPSYKDHWKFYTKESWKRLQTAVEEALRNGTPYELDLEMVRSDKTTSWLTARGEVQRNSTGRIVQLRGTVQDITQRKLIEESQTLFRKLMDGSNDAFEVIDPDTMRFLDVNEKACRDLGYTREELLSMTVHEIVPEVAHQTTTACENRQIFESYHRRKDGSIFPVEINLRNIQLDRDYLVGVARDITERKRAEEILRRSELNYRMFISQSSEGIFCQELDEPIPIDLPEEEQIRRILHQSYMAECNDALARMYGLTSATGLIGQRLTDTLDAESPTNIELTRDFVRGGYRVVERESHEIDVQGNAKIFLNSLMGIVENGMLLRTWGIQRDVTDRRQAEAARMQAELALRENEQRLRLATEAGRMFAYEWDVTTDVVVRSPECVYILGVEEPLNTTWREMQGQLHPDDCEKVSKAIKGCTPENPTCRVNYRVIRNDGSLIWMEKSGRAFFDNAGAMLRMIGMTADITERKLAEEVLSSFSRKLIEAQESERKRIARDLHDDIGQRLALLAVTIEQVKQSITSKDEVLGYLKELQTLTTEISADIQDISHELHSAKLEHLGIVTAMNGFCKELSGQQKVNIIFKHENIPSSLPQEVSLCLFRVLQEALHNAVKYSGVRDFKVMLRGVANKIHLTIHDSGVGFDPEIAMRGQGLGLTSMQERLKLVNGEISIESHPQRGTTIHASVPNNLNVSLRAAG